MYAQLKQKERNSCARAITEVVASHNRKHEMLSQTSRAVHEMFSQIRDNFSVARVVYCHDDANVLCLLTKPL